MKTYIKPSGNVFGIYRMENGCKRLLTNVNTKKKALRIQRYMKQITNIDDINWRIFND